MPDALAAARELADAVLFPEAVATEAAGAVPAKLLDALADAGLYGLAGPPAFGGYGAEADVAAAVAEVLAGGCLTTTFVWAQHQLPVRMLTADPASSLRDVWLGPLCRGERRAGVALGGLLPGPARLRAAPATGGWHVDGTSPWVSGWGLVDVLLVAARGPDETVVWLLDDAAPGPGLRATRQRLVGVDASVTVSLDYTGRFVPSERVVRVEPYGEDMYSMSFALHTAGVLALGVIGRCCRLIGPSPLDDDLAQARTRLHAADDGAIFEARAAGSALAVRAATAAVVAAGSRAILLDEHPQRLLREAAFLLVFGSRPAIRQGLLAVLGAV